MHLPPFWCDSWFLTYNIAWNTICNYGFLVLYVVWTQTIIVYFINYIKKNISCFMQCVNQAILLEWQKLRMNDGVTGNCRIYAVYVFLKISGVISALLVCLKNGDVLFLMSSKCNMHSLWVLWVCNCIQ